jgi:uncharacterized protein (DUF1697 family)
MTIAGGDRTGDAWRVALLRGINVGTAKRVAMADLRALFERLGYRDVRTLLNSGNVVFRSAKPAAADESRRIERAIAKGLGVSTAVMVVAGEELADAVGHNPLASVATEPSRLLLMALRDARAVAQIKPLLNERWAPDAVALRKRTAYLWCANSIAKSRLWLEANRAVGDGGTARNLATMTRILALAGR